jgi:predicted DNA-binding transcriptional regulator YafY
MKFLCYVERLNRINKLIQKRATGNPAQFAETIGVSRTRLYEIIDELKSYGAPIIYDKSCNTFLYDQPYDVSVSFSVKPLNSIEAANRHGGAFFLPAYFFSGRCHFNFTSRKLTGC